MKTLLKILLGLGVVGGAILGFVLWATAGLTDAADHFFTRIAANDYTGAYALTTPDFRAATTQEALQEFAQSNGFDRFRSASWSSRSVQNSVGALEGVLQVEGGVIPVSVQLVKTDGQWLIQNVSKAEAGVASGQ